MKNDSRHLFFRKITDPEALLRLLRNGAIVTITPKGPGPWNRQRGDQ